ncbi:DUF3667 domain-containing protein [Chryseobacterium sp. 1B4]
MEHGKLRNDKTCLNCGYQVAKRFCSHCGQENIENRPSFHFLFTHFIEDFTHYDGQLWKTILYLFTRPGVLTEDYLSGKRQLYVAPVKLYIFISFITFFLSNILPRAKDQAPSSRHNTVQINVEKEKELSIGIATHFCGRDSIIAHKEADSLIKNVEEKVIFLTVHLIQKKPLL